MLGKGKGIIGDYCYTFRTIETISNIFAGHFGVHIVRKILRGEPI